MSYFIVNVVEDGKFYNASRANGMEQARFEFRGDAEDLVDEILAWYERDRPERVVTVEIVEVVA